jgi:hypothetical protein
LNKQYSTQVYYILNIYKLKRFNLSSITKTLEKKP